MSSDMLEKFITMLCWRSFFIGKQKGIREDFGAQIVCISSSKYNVSGNDKTITNNN